MTVLVSFTNEPRLNEQAGQFFRCKKSCDSRFNESQRVNIDEFILRYTVDDLHVKGFSPLIQKFPASGNKVTISHGAFGEYQTDMLLKK